MFDQSIDPRRQYRSVAYGTWKVGGARALMNARSTDDVNKIIRRYEYSIILIYSKNIRENSRSYVLR